MDILHGKTLEEITAIVLALGEKPFRAKQIFSNAQKGYKISEMTNLPKSLRDGLMCSFVDFPCEIIKVLSSGDGTKKYLLKLHDGECVESVLMKYKYGNTLCVSTQVGCRMGCKFCASTLDGLKRNMTAGEILGEVFAVERDNKIEGAERTVTNIVLMGSGEPLDNYVETVRFLRLVSDKSGLNVSLRNVSLSTCGLVKEMYSLAEEDLPINLTVSLHAPFDDLRKTIMPVANKYSIKEIVSACENFFKKTGRRYYFEYSLISGVNDTTDCAEELIRLLKGKVCHVNLIRLNSVKERALIGSDNDSCNAFLKTLQKGGLSATIRRTTGADIDGACGQLRRRYLNDENNKVE